MKSVSVVIPVFNEEALVEELLTRLGKAVMGLPYDFRFLLVDDGSRDGTAERLRSWQEREPRLEVILLSRNWGHQNAFNAGLDRAEGDAVVLMDGDLEDPPEMLPPLLQRWEAGADVVYAVKRSRRESWGRKALFGIFYRLLHAVSGDLVESQSGMFSLLDRRVAERLRGCRERNKYYVGLRSFLGYRQEKVEYDRDPRFAGKPKQTLGRLCKYGLDAVFSFSFVPIRLLTIFGLILLLMMGALSLVLLLSRMGWVQWWPFKLDRGWTSTMVLIMMVAAVQMIFTGLLGEYIARIYDEVRNRPYYLVDRVFPAKQTGNFPKI